jgi:hypothetical protein
MDETVSQFRSGLRQPSFGPPYVSPKQREADEREAKRSAEHRAAVEDAAIRHETLMARLADPVAIALVALHAPTWDLHDLRCNGCDGYDMLWWPCSTWELAEKVAAE